MISNVSSTSRDALQSFGLSGQKTQADAIFVVVQQACRSGIKDMSLQEIKQAYRRLYEREIDVSSVSARVNNLVAAQRLVRDTDTRPCAVSGKGVHPVSVPAKQALMFY